MWLQRRASHNRALYKSASFPFPLLITIKHACYMEVYLELHHVTDNYLKMLRLEYFGSFCASK